MLGERVVMKDGNLKRLLIRLWEGICDCRNLYDIRKNYRLCIMDTEKTIDYIIRNKCSIARYGDGEFSIMFERRGPRFQNGSEALSEALKNVFVNPPDNLLICIPYFFVSTKGMRAEGRRSWKGWALTYQRKVVEGIRKLIGENYCFGDSYVSRPFTAYASNKKAEMVFPMLKELWDGQELLIVEGEQTRLGIGNDLFSNAKSIKRVLAPAENAFDRYSEILKAVHENWHGELVVLALGPTATVMASDLAKSGIQALDVGHVDIQYEWYLQKSREFLPVAGKYTNEAVGGQTVQECKDETYASQIVARIQ